MKKDKNKDGFSRKQFLMSAGGTLLGGGLLTAFSSPVAAKASATEPLSKQINTRAAQPRGIHRVAADPTKLPPPITRKTPKTIHIELEATEVIGEIEKGVKFHYMTFGNQIPSPFIRVRQGDTVIFTLKSADYNVFLHNIDFHAVYGTGGGADATYVTPGTSETIKFKALYPGAFMYHCAVPGMDHHISAGMYGMIFVEPEKGLPKVDHEFYIGQNEIYTDGDSSGLGIYPFDFDRMKAENPSYVLLNGEVGALSSSGRGAIKVKKGETARIFFVNGGPNLMSHLHPIGNVFTRAWREGAVLNTPEQFLQTIAVPPGSCAILDMDFPVPSTIHLVDHALSRVMYKGMGGEIIVEGTPDKSIYDPDYKLDSK